MASETCLISDIYWFPSLLIQYVSSRTDPEREAENNFVLKRSKKVPILTLSPFKLLILRIWFVAILGGGGGSQLPKGASAPLPSK